MFGSSIEDSWLILDNTIIFNVTNHPINNGWVPPIYAFVTCTVQFTITCIFGINKKQYPHDSTQDNKLLKLNTSLCAFCKTVEVMVEVALLRFIGFKKLLRVKNWFYDRTGFRLNWHLIGLSGKALCLIKTVQTRACCPLLR